MQGFKALLVEEEQGQHRASVVERGVDELPAGDLLIDVRYSSVNYKDALSARGNKGVTRNYPHTPGIDAAGIIIESDDAGFNAGDEVIVIGYDLGMNTAGGFGQRIRVPAGWAVPLPEGLTLRESMVLGTAGFTAALCIEKLLHNHVAPDRGDVLVTGATGGVGVVAVALLARLGFRVVASTGKQEQEGFLREAGAAEIVTRESLLDDSQRPLLKERWAAAVDVVGGETLAGVLKAINYGGSVACCGLVGSPALNTAVFPFILRDVNLLGVDSVNQPLPRKTELWTKLATQWKLDNLESLSTEIGLGELVDTLENIFQGITVGRAVLNLQR
ncbi:MAG: YhdH/YhfP family quinone oxidoreductase [Pseudohongiellaceae bacterium]